MRLRFRLLANNAISRRGLVCLRWTCVHTFAAVHYIFKSLYATLREHYLYFFLEKVTSFRDDLANEESISRKFNKK